MLIDLHVHTTVSPCSALGLDQIIGKARSLGLDGVCITDHDTLGAHGALSELDLPKGFTLFTGMEYSTSQGDFLLFGDLVGVPPGLKAGELLRLAAFRGIAVVGAHPFRKWRPLDVGLIGSGRCMIVEGVNGRNDPGENICSVMELGSLGVRFTGGSDAHCLEELGRVPTRFTREVEDSLDLARAINDGDFFDVLPPAGNHVTLPCAEEAAQIPFPA